MSRKERTFPVKETPHSRTLPTSRVPTDPSPENRPREGSEGYLETGGGNTRRGSRIRTRKATEVDDNGVAVGQTRPLLGR